MQYFSLQERKRELQMTKEEEYARTHPDPRCPPGHVLLPEAQRRETLEKLQKGKNTHDFG